MHQPMVRRPVTSLETWPKRPNPPAELYKSSAGGHSQKNPALKNTGGNVEMAAERASFEPGEELEAFYNALAPEERRNRVLLQPAFRDAYNEITESHRNVVIPRYFWAKWLPVLGPVACALYVTLRQYCYHDSRTGELRNLCWPRQKTLAREIGVRDRKTVRKALSLLESHGFIRREHTFYHNPQNALARKGTDRYLVYFEIPLLTSDAARLMSTTLPEGGVGPLGSEMVTTSHPTEILHGRPHAGSGRVLPSADPSPNDQPSPIDERPGSVPAPGNGNISRYRSGNVDNSASEGSGDVDNSLGNGKISRYTVGEKIPLLTSTLTRTLKNVQRWVAALRGRRSRTRAIRALGVGSTRCAFSARCLHSDRCCGREAALSSPTVSTVVSATWPCPRRRAIS